MHTLPVILENMKQELLKERSKKAAWTIIEEYFSFMALERIKQELWILTKGTLTNDLMEQAEKGKDRHNLLFGYEFLLLFLDAVSVLHNRRECKQKKKRFAIQSSKIIGSETQKH